ncbi:MAG: hypothetical protein Q8P48_06435 [Deltaproteobacteria bacterium]|nr:hypothetical protein [Deltaproteobacteria bacterium]
MKKTFAVFAFLLVFLASSTAAIAEETGREPGAGEIMFDLILTRPLGIAALAAGTAVFIVGIPFSLPAGGVGLTARKLVAEPFAFTFTRAVGDIGEQSYWKD